MLSGTTEWVVMIGFAQFGALTCWMLASAVAGTQFGRAAFVAGIVLGAAVGVFVLGEADRGATG